MPETRLAAGTAALRRVGALLLTAALAGVLVAGLVLPVAGLTGFTARQVANGIEELPEQLGETPIAQSTKVYDIEGKRIALFYDENRENVGLDQVAPVMRRAIIAIEDSRFYEHGAIDLEGTTRALVNNLLGNDTQGGSSITQQLVKLLLIEQADSKAEVEAATEESYGRKLRELQYAMAYEEEHTKNEILRDYLNVAFFGDGAYGIASAARHYYSVEPSQLSLVQAATLAGLVQNPTRYNPTEAPNVAIQRRNVVLGRMADLDMISEQRSRRTQREALNLEPTDFSNGCVTSPAPFFCDYVYQYLLRDEALGSTVAERQNRLRTGGLEIYTTLDQRFQQAADTAVRGRVNATDQAIGGMAMIEPGTGEVRALSQSRPMGRDASAGQTFLNYVVPKEYGDSNGFQGGSTFKAFVAAAAIEEGISPQTTLAAPPTLVQPPGTYQDCDGNPVVDTWTVSSSTSSGSMNMYRGIAESVNTYFAELEAIVGVCDSVTMARDMGVTVREEDEVGPFTLGSTDINPVTMASAYATFAARGTYCDPRPVERVVTQDGNEIELDSGGCTRLLEPSTADAMNDMLQGVTGPGGFAYDAGLAVDQPTAGKTGTTQENKAVWFTGYTPNLATSMMIAGANQLGQPITMVDQYIGGQYIGFDTVSGSGFAAPVWAQAMAAVDQWLPYRAFTEPDFSDLGGAEIPVPDLGGLSIQAAQGQLRELGLGTVVGATVDSSYAEGTVASTTPGAGEPVYEGQIVTLNISDGTPYVPPTTEPPADPPTSQPDPPDPTNPPVTPNEPPVNPPGGGAPDGDD